jgi:hypothetical protein
MPERRFPPPWSVQELDALLCQIESRIKKTPAFRAGVFLYANKSGARGVGGMGESARLVVTLDRRLFRICIELLTLNRQWISGITRLASNCERAAHCGEHREAAGAIAQALNASNSARQTANVIVTRLDESFDEP